MKIQTIKVPRLAILRTFDHLCRECLTDLNIPIRPGDVTINRNYCPAKAYHLKSRNRKKK